MTGSMWSERIAVCSMERAKWSVVVVSYLHGKLSFSVDISIGSATACFAPCVAAPGGRSEGQRCARRNASPPPPLTPPRVPRSTTPLHSSPQSPFPPPFSFAFWPRVPIYPSVSVGRLFDPYQAVRSTIVWCRASVYEFYYLQFEHLTLKPSNTFTPRAR